MASASPLVELLTGPWAILPEKLFELQAIYTRHVHGEAVDLAAIEARLGRPLANDQQAYTLRAGGVAVLEIAGVISPKANLFTKVSGGAAASLLQQQMDSMTADPRVVGAVLDWDTPGGNVLGIPALAQSIRRLAAAKPTVSVSTGTMASAGYWAGCAANAVYISGLTDNLGSLGVVATHRYDPRATQVQTTEIAVGKYKRMASESGPLTAEGEAYIRAQLDEVYRVLINSVAESRNASVEDVLQHMADGRLFIGQQALDAGLADGVATVDDLVEHMATDPGRFAKRRTASFAVARPAGGPAAAAAASSTPIETTGADSMTPQEQAAKFVAENPEAAGLLRAEGANGERERIKAVRGQSLAGHEQLIEQLAFDGKTTGPEAAVAVLNAERSLAATRVADIAADAPKPLAADATSAAADKAADADADKAPANPMAEAKQLAAAIAKKQAAATAAGQTLSAVDALALVRKETANA